MRFNLVMLQGKGFDFLHFLFPGTQLIAASLEELGHSCMISRNGLVADRINILIGSHTLRDPAVVQQVIGSGARYVVFQTEVVLNRQVNLSGDLDHFNTCYLPLLRGAASVWEGQPGQLEFLEGLGLPVDMFSGGWHSCMETAPPRANKDIDFLFFGSVSPHRRTLLKALQDRGHRVTVTFDAPAIYRDDLVSRAKVHLAPRRAEPMRHLAYGRILYLIANRAPVVVERCDDQAWLEDCFLHAETEDWVDLCVETLARSDLEALGETFYERVQSRRFVDQMRPLLHRLEG